MSLRTPILTTSPEISAEAVVVSARVAATPNMMTSLIEFPLFVARMTDRTLMSQFTGSSSHAEIVVQLVHVLRKIIVADHVDDAAVLDNIMAVGERCGEMEILLDQEDREPLFLQPADHPANLLHDYRGEAFGR